MMRLRRFRPLLWLMVGWSGSVVAAERDLADRLDGIDYEVSRVEHRIDSLSRDYSQRRGLIGSEEALQRFEDAVYIYLIGEYERAATSFYTLVESEALTHTALAHDSQWYLAECLFELGNFNTALDVYDAVIDVGATHPFFNDAVVRELEIFGLLRDYDRLYKVYSTWILSGKVPENDRVRYTVAKSFYRLGEAPRAKSKFSELQPDSLYYGRARYFLGTINAAQGDHEVAIAEFQRVVSLEGSEDPAVLELAYLALGRLYYEIGDYPQATDYYQKISSDSPWFADQLYELVWTLIKQERWEEAVRHVEIFLIAFPEHRYSMQLQLNQGHLHMKEAEFERALASYETVVESYTPLHDQLHDLETSREDPAIFFQRIVDDEVFEDGEGLPKYAVEMLADEDEFARAVDIQRALASQESDLAEAEGLVADIHAALAAGDDSIGTFGRGRANIMRVHNDSLALRASLVEAELLYMAANAADEAQPDVQAARAQWEVLQTRSADVQGAESARTDRYQVYEDQVREVQGEAFRISQLAVTLEAEIVATRRALEEKKNAMSVEDVNFVARELKNLEGDLEEVQRDLDALQSSSTRRAVMASVPKGRTDRSDSERSLIARDYDGLRDGVAGLRGKVTAGDRSVVFSRIDSMWNRLEAVDRKANSTREQLDTVELQELDLLRRRLGEETTTVRTLNGDLAQTQTSASVVAVEVTKANFGRLEDKVFETVMEADKGIVDVYWLRKTNVADEITRLARERGLRLDELNDRFNVIRQKMEE